MAMTPELRNEILSLVEDVLRRELQSRFVLQASVLPQKISPVKLDGSLPANGDPLIFDAASGLVTF